LDVGAELPPHASEIHKQRVAAEALIKASEQARRSSALLSRTPRGSSPRIRTDQQAAVRSPAAIAPRRRGGLAAVIAGYPLSRAVDRLEAALAS
jgi:hypothetical protein